VLFDLVSGKNYAADLRAEALSALADRNDPKLPDAVKIGLDDAAPRLREQAIHSLAKLPGSVPQLSQFLKSGTTGEQQAALAALADAQDKEADAALAAALAQLRQGDWKPQLQLDLIEAVQKRNNPVLVGELQAWESSLPKNDALAEFRVSLLGGSAENGRAVFERSDASCIRCHTVHKQGGIVGPVLDGIGARQPREYLLESIILPNAKIAPGFETVAMKLKDGKTVTGILKSETPAEITLLNADGLMVKIPAAQVEARTRGVSAMPEGFGKTLNKRDLRDLVEYLAELKN
jgi:quinoprotein glucose dehydrogenase